MRLYIPGPDVGKVEYLKQLGAVVIEHEEARKIIGTLDAPFGVITVVENPTFEAAAYTDTAYEFDTMTGPSEMRPLTFLKMEIKWVMQNSGYLNHIHRQNALAWWRGQNTLSQRHMANKYFKGTAFPLVSASSQKVTEMFLKEMKIQP
jgi:hypothetical protein